MGVMCEFFLCEGRGTPAVALVTYAHAEKRPLCQRCVDLIKGAYEPYVKIEPVEPSAPDTEADLWE